MTPMIDVVFLLIIFFLVSSHLARQENHLPLDLPTASTFDPTDPDKSPLTISINASANVLVAGNIIPPSELADVFSDFKDRAGTDAAIRIRCEGNVQYRFVEPVLRSAAIAGVTDAAIAVRETTK
jgi:biopolymer transport protein ExbD